MDPLPTGTVTMLFTDIEGSTALLSRLGDRYGEALSTQRRIVRTAIERSSGWEMGTEGDSFFVVFESAHDAVAACLHAQRALAASTWPDGAAARVRMGVHTGEPTRLEEGYVGLDLNRAARIAAAAHGGQIVVSSATGQLVGNRLPDGVELVDLGWHRLKDIDQPEHILQLTAPDLPTAFPPLRTLGAQTSLPIPATPLVGRDDEVQELQALVGRPGLRLLTLTGPGGVGKTRLALALATTLDSRFRDGIYFVPLATVSSADVMWKVIADAVGPSTEVAAATAVPEHLAVREALMVLDNLEQLADAAQVVAALLAAAPRLVVIATSRRPMHLQGEWEFPVPPLSGPSGLALEQIAGSGAVNLFCQQGALVRRGFSLTPSNAADIASICRRLDGLPLAIELAASRLKLLPPKALLSRLADSLDLAASDVDRPSRQQTLRATVAWSYDLLAPDLQRVFRRMGVFAGGCDLDAVQAVALDPDTPAEVEGAVQTMADLLDTSLVTVAETPEADIRVGMLETIREYALDQLVRAGELDAVRQRHAEYYTAFAEQAGAELRGSRRLIWLDRLETEHDNLRAALSWTLDGEYGGDRQRPALGLRLVNGLSWFWYGHSHVTDGRRWLELAIDRATGDEGPALAGAAHGLGVLLLQEGEHERARAVLERNLAAWRSLGDEEGLAKGLNSLGVTCRDLGEFDVARRHLEESLRISRRIGSESRLSTALSNLATVEIDTGSPERGIALLRESIELGHRLGDAWAVVVDQGNLAGAMLLVDRAEEAQQLLSSLVDDVVGIGDPELTADTLERLAATAAELGADKRAACLSGTAERMREVAGIPMTTPDRVLLERALGPARSRVPAHAWEREVSAGRQMTQVEALSLARQPLDT